MKYFSILCLIFIILNISSDSIIVNGGKVKSDVINAFLIPHSHCDVGWVQTYEQYYTENVTVILDNVINILINDPTKKFNWVEIVYFERWWNEQPAIIQSKVRDLVNNKQLYFIGGGWAMNDEATIHYEAIINQMTLGHQFLLSTFGFIPEIGWQIDPFGPSTIVANLFSLMGFKYHVINRIDERLKYVFNNETVPNLPGSGYMSTDKELEFVWYPSPNNQDLSIFTHILDHHYGPPYLSTPNASNPNISIVTGFDFEHDPNVNPPINDSNIYERACILVEIIQQRQAYNRHQNVLLPYGNDFAYQNQLLFENMDKLIKYINSNSSFGVNIQYATLNEYFEAVFKETDHSTKIFPELVAGDYFIYTMCLENDYYNYGTCANYWSGYYTSYPLLKGTVRESDSILRVGEFLYALSSAYENGFSGDFDFNIGFYALDFHRNVSGILTHHDATTGTSKYYVRENYFEMLYEAETLTLNYNIPHFVGYLLANQTINKDYTSNGASLLEGAQIDDIFAISFTNSLAWDRNEFISIEIPSNINVAVYDSNFNPIISQIIERQDKNGKWYLYYQVSTSALGISTYFIVVLDINNQVTNLELLNLISTNSNKYTPIPSKITLSEELNQQSSQSSTISIGNSLYNLNFKFNSNNKHILSLNSYDDLIRNQMNIPLSQSYIEYKSLNDDAYKFRPTGLPITLTPINPQFYYTSGPIVEMITIIYNNNCSQSFIVYNSNSVDNNNNKNNNSSMISDDQFFEIENTVASGWNKEIALRFTTPIQNSNKFYTNNGLEMMKREYQVRWNDTKIWSEVSGNFYPVVNTAYIADDNNQLTLLTKQTVGGSSQNEGQLELLLIRRSSFTQWSVGEPMNDTSNPTIKIRVLFGEPSRVELIRSPHSLLLENPLFPVYTRVNHIGIEKWLSIYNTIYKPLKEALPYNIHLLTLTKQWIDSSVNIFRAINIYEIGQNNGFSQPTNLSLQQLLYNFNVSNIVETTLSANNILPNQNINNNNNQNQNNIIVTLNPIQLKTYLLNLNSK